MPSVLHADAMGLGKTHTSPAAAMFCKLHTGNVVFGQPLSILWGHTLDEWINQAQNDYPAVPPKERGWYPLTKKNLVLHWLLEIKTTPPYGHPCLVSAHEPILIVTLPGICEMCQSGIKDMSHNTDFTIIDLLEPNHYNLTNEDLNASADEPERKWKIHLKSYNTLTARAKLNCQRQLTKCTWSVAIFDQSHRYKGCDFQGWSVAVEAKIGVKLQVTVTPAYNMLNDRGNQTIWWLSGAPIRPEDNTLMELHGADALHMAVRSLTQGIRSDDDEAQKAAAEQIIRIAKPWTI
ncbi:hypothetical protein BDD12DRAFT_806924 [Trichophaea hybrida]|nr:hypothetical protein BDD12DRAFT_806924 [Trichophaea hybrida]